MKKTIFELLEDTAQRVPEKIAFIDNTREIDYNSFLNESKLIATNILKYNLYNQPIAIYIDKTIECLTSMIGVNYSGNFYTIIDTKMPLDRVNNIFSTLEPKCILTTKKNIKKLENVKNNYKIIFVDELEKDTVDENALSIAKSKIIDTNPMYVLFTSGSTGTPKGTVLSHRAVISYVLWYKETFNINDFV